MSSIPAPLCTGCIHVIETDEILKCDAFPDGIPEDITENRADHRKAYPGDHGIRFLQNPRRNEPGILIVWNKKK